jgi:hypothetical protein
MKTRKLVDVDLYGAIGTGATRAEAKAQAAAKIQAAFSDQGSYCPDMFRFPKGETATIYRTLEGWTYGILWPGEEHKRQYGMGVFATKRDANQAMRRNLAQLYWNDHATEYGHELLAALDEEGHRLQDSYRRFQRRYQELKAEGWTDTQCHYEACQAMSA